MPEKRHSAQELISNAYKQEVGVCVCTDPVYILFCFVSLLVPHIYLLLIEAVILMVKVHQR